MQRRPDQNGFLNTKAGIVLSAALLLQAALLYGFSRTEVIPEHQPLANLQANLGGWEQNGETEVEKEVQEILKADDLLNRSYANPAQTFPVSLFVAFFKSQRGGVAPHSPKNCLPGSGWAPLVSDTIKIDVPGRAEPIEANRYIVQRGEAKSMVLYWYQSRDRTVASEYTAKYYVLADAIRYNRTDTALVRIVVPLGSGDPEPGQQAAIDFVRSMYGPLRKHFPA